jgi:hypothetical protein
LVPVVGSTRGVVMPSVPPTSNFQPSMPNGTEKVPPRWRRVGNSSYRVLARLKV